MEVEAAEAAVLPLLLNSRKRTYDLFLRNHGNRLPDDTESQKMKLAVKVNDEYAKVRHLPPPPKKAATNSARARAAQTAPSASTASGEAEVIVKGGHPVPSGPGVALSDDTTAPIEEPSTEAFTELLKNLPGKKEPQNAWGIVEYKGAAGIDERFKAPQSLPTRALVRKGLNLEKPVWHPPWKLMRVISGHLGWVRSVVVEPGNEWFATGSADRTIKIWDLASGTLKLTLTGHINAPRGLAVSTRHPYLFSCGEDKMVKCWDLEYNKSIRNYHGHLSAVYCLALHPTIDVLITGGRDSVARVWDIRTKSQVHVLGGHSATVYSLATQATDPQIISGSMDSTVKMWDLAAGKSMATLTNHKKGVRSVVLHPSEYSFISGSADNIKKWKLPEGNFLQNFSGHDTIVNCMALNADNVLVSGGDNGSLFFWDWKTGYNFQQQLSKVQPGSLDCEAAIYSMTFDQSGARLITCEADKTIKVWKEDTDATEEEHPIDWKPSRSEKRW